MEKNKWIYSFDECAWDGQNEYLTKEEAIEAARNEKQDPDQTIWVGTKTVVDKKYLLDNAKLFDLDDFNEELEEVCTDEDCYLSNGPVEELREMIADFIIKKFDKNIMWIVEYTQEVRL
jgi:hypothetical protein